MKSPNLTPKETAAPKTVSKPLKPGLEMEPEAAEERLEATQAHDLRRESGHSRKNERHMPEKMNQVRPPAKP